MNIVVFLKQDMQEKARVRDTFALNAESLTVSDLYALELAGRIKDKYPETRIIGMSLCLDASSACYRQGLIKALSLVCDKACMVSDPEFVHYDALAQSRFLSRAIRVLEQTEGKVDIVIDGEQEQDGAIGVTGPMAAELLHIPSVSSVLTAEVEMIETSKSSVRVNIKKRAEDETWWLRAMAPLLLTVTEGDYDVRYPAFKRIRWANTQEILPLTRRDLFDDGEERLTGAHASTTLFRTFTASRAGEWMRIEGDDPAKAARILMSQLKLKVLSGQI